MKHRPKLNGYYVSLCPRWVRCANAELQNVSAYEEVPQKCAADGCRKRPWHFDSKVLWLAACEEHGIGMICGVPDPCEWCEAIYLVRWLESKPPAAVQEIALRLLHEDEENGFSGARVAPLTPHLAIELAEASLAEVTA